MNALINCLIGKWRPQALLLALMLVLFPPLSMAQPEADVADIQEIRRGIDVFAGVLRDSLDLNVRQSIFHPRAGDVSGRYLARQGVVIELATPLRARRGTISRLALQQSMNELSEQFDGDRGNRRLLVQRPDTDAMREALALSLRRDQAALFYRQMMEQLAEIDGYAVADSALRTAGDSARLLRSMGAMVDQALEQQLDELARLRTELADSLVERENLQRDLRQASAGQQEEPDDEQQQQWQAALEALQSQMNELTRQAVQHAEELREHSDAMRAAQLDDWRQEVIAFEHRLFSILCDYGASLRSLPDDEHLSLVLSGLGEDTDSGDRTDRIHVLEKTSLMQCQRGDIDAMELIARARSYDM